MSDFQMNPVDVQGVSILMSRLADGASDLELAESDGSLDCGDTVVREVPAYFVSMHNKRGQTMQIRPNGRSDSLYATARTFEDIDDETAESSAAPRAKLQG